MSLDSLQADYDDFYTPRFEVRVGGDTLQESSGVISSVTVETTMDRAARFSFSLDVPFDLETGTFSDVEMARFETGTDVEIRIGYGDGPAATPEPVLVGKIASLRPDFPSGGKPTIEVSGYDLLHEMGRVANYEFWAETTESDAVADVAAKYGLRSTADSTDLVRYDLKLDPDVYESDLQFVNQLARRNRYEYFVRGRTLHFRRPRDGTAPTLTLAYGEALSSFSPELDDSTTVRRVEVRAWDPEAAEPILGVAERDEGVGTKVLRAPVRSQAEAEEIAEAVLYGEADDRLDGRGETIGLPALRIGEPIELRRLDRFSGTYYVTGVTHRVGPSGYTTSFEVAGGSS